MSFLALASSTNLGTASGCWPGVALKCLQPLAFQHRFPDGREPWQGALTLHSDLLWFHMVASCTDNGSGFLGVLFSFTPASLSLGLSGRGSHDSWPHQESPPSATSLSKELPGGTQQPQPLCASVPSLTSCPSWEPAPFPPSPPGASAFSLPSQVCSLLLAPHFQMPPVLLPTPHSAPLAGPGWTATAPWAAKCLSPLRTDVPNLSKSLSTSLSPVRLGDG